MNFEKLKFVIIISRITLMLKYCASYIKISCFEN